MIWALLYMCSVLSSVFVVHILISSFVFPRFLIIFFEFLYSVCFHRSLGYGVEKLLRISFLFLSLYSNPSLNVYVLQCTQKHWWKSNITQWEPRSWHSVNWKKKNIHWGLERRRRRKGNRLKWKSCCVCAREFWKEHHDDDDNEMETWHRKA